MFLNAHGYFLHTCNAFSCFLWNLGAPHRHMGGHEIDHFEVVQKGIIFNWSPYSNSSLFGQIGPNSILTISNLLCLCFMTSKLLISHSVFHYFWNLGQSWCSKILISRQVFRYFRKPELVQSVWRSKILISCWVFHYYCFAKL